MQRRDAVALAAATCVVAAAAVPVAAIGASGNPGAVATVVQGYVAPVSLALIILPWILAWWRRSRSATTDRKPQRPDDATADLLAARLAEWLQQQLRVRGLLAPAPIRLSWTLDTQFGLPPGDLVADAPAGLPLTARPLPNPTAKVPGSPPVAVARPRLRGYVDDLYGDVLTRLTHGQLVLLGEAGAGKSSAALTMAGKLLTLRAPGDAVPTWVKAADWHPADGTFRKYVFQALWSATGGGRLTPAAEARIIALAASGRIVLFVDGLDELPALHRIAAMEQIDELTLQMRSVLTCRPAEWEADRLSSRLRAPAVVRIQPVSLVAARRYLTQLPGDPTVRQQFRHIAERIAEHPASPAAAAFTNPLNLALTRASYFPPDAFDADDLLDAPSAAAIRERLIGRFLRTAYPEERSRREATRWLAWIAQNMEAQTTVPWWDIPQWCRRSFMILVAIVLLFKWPLQGVVLWQLAGAADFDALRGHPLLGFLATSFVTWLCLGFPAGLRIFTPIGAFPGERAGLLGTAAQTLPTLFLREHLERLVGGDDQQDVLAEPGYLDYFPYCALFAVPIGLALGLVELPRIGWTGASAVAALACATISLLFPFATFRAVSVLTGLRAVDVFRLDLVSTVRRAAIFAMAFGVPVALFDGLQLAVPLAVAGGWAFAALRPILITEYDGSSWAILAAEVALFFRDRRRISFMHFLADAMRREVLWRDGYSYEFRHRELQIYLAARSEPADRSPDQE